MPRPCATTSAASNGPMPDFRAASLDDAPRLSQLASWVWLHTYAQDGVRASFADYLERTFSPATLAGLIDSKTQTLWVAEQDGHLLAWAHGDLGAACPVAGVYGPQAELSRLYVVPPAQGRGLGAALLRRLRASWPERAFWLSAWVCNEGALRFYRREGARQLGETWFELGTERHRNEVLAWSALQESS